MSHLLYSVKKHYFIVILSTSIVASISAAGLTGKAVQSAFIPDEVQSQIEPKKNSRQTTRSERISLAEFDGLLTGNLLRDSAELSEEVRTGAPENIVLTGTVAGPWHLAMATIRVEGERKSKEYPSGAKVDDYRIVWIGRGKVVVKDEAGERYTIKASDKKPPLKKKRRSKRRSRTKAKAGGTITKVISRDEVMDAVKNPTTIYKDLRIGPKTKGGEIYGYRIKRLGRKHLFYKLGARSGDTITRINGQDMDNHEKMLGLLQELKTADKLSVDVDRRGTPTSFNIIIK